MEEKRICGVDKTLRQAQGKHYGKRMERTIIIAPFVTGFQMRLPDARSKRLADIFQTRNLAVIDNYLLIVKDESVLKRRPVKPKNRQNDGGENDYFKSFIIHGAR